jgi:DNA invertase Pin-like site-specific DNA recombinase
MKYFLYCRKSTDEVGKQILSLESQRDDLERRVPLWPAVEIVAVLEEARSAKTLGRPIFNEMVKRITAGEAEGIVAWDPDRLARNSVDGGKIIHMLDSGKLKDLKFATYSFENSAQGKFMLSIMFGNSKYFVDTLSVNVKRGMRTKAEKGWFPSLAPLGYTNDSDSTYIVRDPERFALVRRMWQLMLTGGYSVRQIYDIVNDEWGLRTVKRNKIGGGKLTLSGCYRVLSNPFYAGVFVWAGRTWPGKHEAMITLADFEQVQRLLGRPSQSRSKTREFALTGLLRCGECGFAITAQEQVNRHGSRYVYYHCTKKKPGYRCGQRSLSDKGLDEQVQDFLTKLRVPEAHAEWAAERVLRDVGGKQHNVHASTDAIDRAIASNARERANLTTLRVRDLLDDVEFAERRSLLDRENLRLAEERRALDVSRSWIQPYEKLKVFSIRAADWYRRGDARTKRLILTAAGSNPSMKDKKLSIEARLPLRAGSWPARISEMCSTLNDVKTLVATNDPNFLSQLEAIDEVVRLTKPLEPGSESKAA